MKQINLILLLLITCSVQTMQIIDQIALPTSKSTQFSPRGDLLLVVEENEVGLYETHQGKRIGSLEGFNSTEWDETHPFRFSPGQTYLSYRNTIWTVSDQSKLFYDLTHKNCQIWWDKSESIFIMSPDIGEIYSVYDTHTLQSLQTLTWPSAASRLAKLNNDGSLIASLYRFYTPEPNFPWYTSLQIKETLTNNTTLSLSRNCTNISFFSDNIHALITTREPLMADIILIDAKRGCTLRTFLCSNYVTAESPLCYAICQVVIEGLTSLITHPSAKDYCCTISSDGKEFQFQKLDRSRIFKKNIPVPSHEQLQSFNHKEHTMSPDGYSLVLTTKAGTRLLCIAKHFYDQLAADRSSYLSLLPADLRAHLRKYKATDPLIKSEEPQ